QGEQFGCAVLPPPRRQRPEPVIGNAGLDPPDAGEQSESPAANRIQLRPQLTRITVEIVVVAPPLALPPMTGQVERERSDRRRGDQAGASVLVRSAFQAQVELPTGRLPGDQLHDAAD